MPIELEYDPSIHGLYIKATGNIVYTDLPVLAKQLMAHPDFRTNISQLFDCTEGKLDLSTDDLDRIARDFMQVADILGRDRRLALVVSRDVDFGKLRQYEVFFESGPGVEVNIFRSLHDARKWLQPYD